MGTGWGPRGERPAGKNLEDWLELVKNTFKDRDRLPYMAMIGNKMDLGQAAPNVSLLCLPHSLAGMGESGEDWRGREGY